MASYLVVMKVKPLNVKYLMRGLGDIYIVKEFWLCANFYVIGQTSEFPF